MWTNLPALATAVLAVLPATSAFQLPASYKGPKSIADYRKACPYHHPAPDHRNKVYIRASKNDTDDISAEFYAGLQKANHGGTLVLPEGKTFVIGKKLDLTFLDNVQVQLDGKILVCNIYLQLVAGMNLTCRSSPIISPTGRITISTIPSRSLLLSGNGVEKILRFSALEL